ncbi:pentatricopeptide repeat-containing protein At4g32430, mitochondrial [Aristolochia californica]|uniref:pentatricopeptide repeat-containing protein At4g32430, mitochondrial n=1 Tax=Aristolochia californica TaxID=171875 RepID=UPI0035E315A5
MFVGITHGNWRHANTPMLKRFSLYLPPHAFNTLQKQLRSSWAEDLDHVTLSVALKCCSTDLKSGTQIHSLAISSGLDTYLTVSNSLMNMYCKTGNFGQAFSIFESLCYPDIVSWNTILSGFSHSSKAHEFTYKMHISGINFDAVTYTSALAFCSDLRELPFGLVLHSLLLKSGYDCDTFVANSLVSMYFRCCCLDEAKRVFDEMGNRDLISWNAMLSGYNQMGNFASEALSIFMRMMNEGIQLDHVSFSSVLSAISHEGSLELGKQLHGLVVKAGCESHVSVSNVLMSIYSKCDLTETARLVFDSMTERNVISWTTLISIDGTNAMSIFDEMRKNNVPPNEVTFIALIHAISTENLLKEGCIIHGICIKTGHSRELNVANCLISMYAKFKSIEDSRKIFNKLINKEIISWNAMISGFAQNGLFLEALQTFQLMILESKPTEFTFGSVLSAIASAEAIPLMHGWRCHCCTIKAGFATNPIISSALIDMYAKRGSIKEAQLVFDENPQENPVAWTAIISAYSRHGNYENAMDLFKEMEQAGMDVDSVTFLAILTACGRSGMVNTGCQVFEKMVKDYGIKPSGEHYACMVDILGRAGQLEEAEEFMKRIPGKPGLSTLQSLFWASKVHGNVELGERVGEALMGMESTDSGVCVSLSNMYAYKGDWVKVAKIRKRMRERGLKKEVGFSWVDVGYVEGSMQMHGFSSDDRSHQQAEEIYRMAECLIIEMKFFESEMSGVSYFS